MSRSLVALTVMLLPAIGWAQHGGIHGQVVLDGDLPSLVNLVKNAPAVCGGGNIPNEGMIVDPKTKGVANVVVFLRRKPDDAGIPAKLAAVPDDVLTYEQSGCRFIPHVMVVRTGQSVKLLNRDGGPHNPQVHPIKNLRSSSLINPQNRDGIVTSLAKPETAPISISCDIHPWMRGYWVVVDHPYAAVTGPDGKFKINDLPEGEHEFRVWHESVGFIEKSLLVTVVSDKITDVPAIKLKAADMNK